MRISVINMTSGAAELKREDVLRVVRAVNRQVTEDFAPQWHMHAQLRVDMALSRDIASAKKDHASLRGDGIIYLVNALDVDDALGYHDRHAQGIPYALVDVAVGKQLDSAWSVTFSHEVLEMIADPDVNLLCRGPHPGDARRDVFHWFEMCDAVQDETYEIDGVKVSNFVLPAYFTTGVEGDGRTDFLARPHAGKLLPSFGINPGGYVGFFDPRSNDDTTFSHPGDGRARERLRLRAQNAGQRRSDRRIARNGGQRRPTPRPSQEELGDGAPEAVQLDALFVRLVEGVSGKVAPIKIPGWSTTPFRKGTREFLLRPDAGPRAVSPEDWDRLEQLRGERRVEKAELLLIGSPEAVPTERGRPGAGLRASSSGSDEDLPETDNNHRWSLNLVRAPEAWALAVPDGGKKRGAGIRVGHPDTGYTLHPEVEESFALADARNFLNGNNDAKDPLDEGFLGSGNPGHGTATASVIASGFEPGGAHIVGVAPEAKVVPLRVATRVWLPSASAVAQAIYHAVDRGMHVLSISLGGFHSDVLHDAVRHAVSHGVIVVAAAGNKVPTRFVVWPAAYDEVIAAAACNIRKEPWSGSSHGATIDVTAPGESVWVARTQPDGSFELDRGTGTSYAVTNTAGAAALWLAHHGRTNLIAKYGPAGVPAVFRELLMTHGVTRPPGWDTTEFGPGILDAHALLEAPLPASAPAHGMRARRARLVSDDHNVFERIAHVCNGVSRDALRERLHALLGTDEDSLLATLERHGDELTFLFVTDPALRSAFTADARRGLAAGRMMRREPVEISEAVGAEARLLLGRRGSRGLRTALPAPARDQDEA